MNEKKNLVMAVNQNNTPGIETICKLIYIHTFLKKSIINSIYVFSKIQLVVYYQCCIFLIG